MRLAGFHEQAIPRRLLHDELVQLLCLAAQARVAAALAGPGVTWLALPDGMPGRPAVSPDAAIRFCLTIEDLFRLPRGRRPGWWPAC